MVFCFISGVLEYLTHTWLNSYRDMFVTAWTNRTRNFGQRTTNRVESQHSNLKRFLRSPNSTLASLVGFVNEIVQAQEVKMKHDFETSLIKTMGHHKLPIFDNLRGKVSHKALDLLVEEKDKIRVMRDKNMTCGHQLWTSCGLPCACNISKYYNTGS